MNVSSIFFSAQKYLTAKLHVLNGEINNFHRLSPLLQAAGTVQDPSRIIMVSSVAGVVVGDMGEHGTYAYAASKAAVIHLMKNLVVELGPKHITVNVVAPEMVPSQMSAPLMNRHGGIESVSKQVPDQKLGSPEDVAGVMVFLSSRASKHINGATIVLDGGSYLVRGCA
ncbi:hypothetical protein CGLO_08607 [Colletotrichum gloeosporioides Cg-14]|uniref:Short chain dehydrogenase n=1 Tax=Colletotrichum gloeosporioides (strain Cg-14) TaxID=1237896 RepID=T0KHX8_COLGC|nr:hypothetical protein CGLO_08607 [Colletotrichum gloeosporioides Cg-14]